MNYKSATQVASRKGKTLKLPNFEGYFNWDYSTNKLVFINKDFRCDAEQLDILTRNDFYFIV